VSEDVVRPLRGAERNHGFPQKSASHRLSRATTDFGKNLLIAVRSFSAVIQKQRRRSETAFLHY
ncbi:MAG: hypothetical protein IKW18_08925, partial [Clostridia bacterium]|nr:hypothetical protein [Clostridia bacterium]